MGFKFKNYPGFKKALASADAKQRKAAQDAVKVKGFRLRGQLISEVKKGAPGGSRFAPLSSMRKEWIGNPRLKALRPFATGASNFITGEPPARDASPIRYNAALIGKDFKVEIGFVDTASKKLSKSWKRLAEVHQTGFAHAISPAMRKALARKGAKLKREGKRFAKRLFLKKSTTRFSTPARPIIDPFWSTHSSQASRDIEIFFEKKMRGERI